MARVTKASTFSRILTDVEVAWLAGILDGEGNIRVDYPNPRYPDYAYPKVIVVNTCLPLLERIKEITGVGQIKSRSWKAKDHHKDSWHWVVGGHAAISVLNQILELLIAKQDHALAALSTSIDSER